jgi:PIN domain nuclease of toxin-antitoxin system
MKVLLDTHVFLWAITDNPQLSRRAREIFAVGRNVLFLSAASVWEILTKVQVGKLPLPTPVGGYLKQQLTENDVQVLPILLAHILQLEQLPLHHRDPFDRILVAQSLEENLPIVTADPLLERYAATLIW